MDRDKLIEMLTDPAIKVVSFNLHETLILRPMITLAQLFPLVGKRAGYGRGFKEMRVTAEQAARARMPIYDEDITLDNIYKAFSELFDVDAEMCRRLQNEELAVDLKYSYPRKFMKEIYNTVKAAGKEIIITAKTYLPKSHIEAVLEKTGFTGYAGLYLSGTEKASNRTGRLYFKICADYMERGILPERIVHVGSNDNIDARKVEFAGMIRVSIPSPREYLQQNEKLSELNKFFTASDDNGLAYGFLINLLYDNPFVEYQGNTLFGGKAENIGNVLFGPLLLAFVKWMTESAIRESLDLLLFIYRDGYIPVQVYEKLKLFYEGAPDCKTGYCSTAMRLNYAAKEQDGFFKSFLLRPPSPDMTIEEFIRYRLMVEDEKEIDEIFAIFKSYGYNTQRSKLGYLKRDFAILKKVEPYFIRHALANAEHIDRYIAQLTNGYDKLGLFDVGTRGRVGIHFKEHHNQDNICYHIFRRTFADIPEVNGFNVKSFWQYSHCISVDTNSLIDCFMEDAISIQEGSMMNVKDRGDGSFFYIRQPGGQQSNLVIDNIQTGILRFCSEFIGLFTSDLPHLFFDGNAMMEFMLSFLIAPKKEDADLIKDLKYFHSAHVSFTPLNNYQNWYDDKINGITKDIRKKAQADSAIVEDTWEAYRRNYDKCLVNLPTFQDDTNDKILFVGPMSSQISCNFVSQLAGKMINVSTILLSETISENNISKSVYCDYVMVPQLFKHTKILQERISVSGDMADALQNKPYLRDAADNMIAKYSEADRSYVTAWAYYADKYFQKVIDIYHPVRVVIWNSFYALHQVFIGVCKANHIETAIFETGQIPGTLFVDKGGQVSDSAVTVRYEQFKALPVSNDELEKAKEIITSLKTSGSNRYQQPVYFDFEKLKKTIDPGKPNILYLGQFDEDSGLSPYNKHAKEFCSPIYSSIYDTVSHLSQLAKKNGWNLIFKPHPLTLQIAKKSGKAMGSLLPDNVCFVERADINKLVLFADVVVVGVSGVNYVSAIQEKATVMVGYTNMLGKDCTYEAFTRDTVEPAIKEALEKGFTVEQKRNFELHVAQMLKYYLYDDLSDREIRYGRTLTQCADDLLSARKYNWLEEYEVKF